MPHTRALLFLLLPLGACHKSEPAATLPQASVPALAVTPIDSPAGPGAAEPFVATGADGAVLLSWLERPGNGPASLRIATRGTGGAWSAPASPVASGPLFVNWADFPSVAAAGDGTLVAHWLEKTAASPYAYHVKLARSEDGGRTWTPGVVAHQDRSATEHGFVSLVPAAGGSVDVLWLDGRNMGGHGNGGGGAMTLRFATLDRSNRMLRETLLDDRVCECCQTAMVRTAKGLVAAYRDRSEDEVRDIAVVVEREGTWSKPRLLASDGWKINACPVNGPQLDAAGDSVVAAWFSMGGNTPRVRVAFSRDAGESFGPPIALDDGSPLGRVDVSLVGDETALVTWIEQTSGGASLRARLASPEAPRGPSIEVSGTAAARSSGFPRQVRVGAAVYVAWTASQSPSRVGVVRLDLAE